MSKSILESKRLFLRPLSWTELQDINCKEWDEMETAIEPESISDSLQPAIAKKLNKMKDQPGSLHDWYTYWLIICKETQKGIGFIGFKGIPDGNGHSEIGYSISPNYRKKGLMTEALAALINWASQFPNAKGITANVLKTNIGSIKVLENCNFKQMYATEQNYHYRINLR